MANGKEQVGVEDQVSIVLYDQHGRVKQIANSKKQQSKSKLLKEFVSWVLRNW